MAKLSFTVIGRPIAKQRVNHFIRKGTDRIGTSTPLETRMWENMVAMSAHVAMKEQKIGMFTGPIRMGIKAYFPVPATRAKKLQEGEVNVQRPDWSNIEKSIEDGCIGVAFQDDCIIVGPCAGGGRFWTHQQPRAEVWIVEVDRFGNEVDDV